MSKIDDLLKKHCPNGVEYKKIKEVFTRLKGTPITATRMKEIECAGGEIRIFAGGKTVIDAKEKDIPNANITRVPAVLVQSRGVIDFIYYEKPFTFKNEMWAYTSDNKISVKYLFHVLKNNSRHFRDAASGMGALPQISLSATEDFVIPVPPLEVQREIVQVLDSFTMLTAELTARKKQYEYYRDQLLSFNNVRGGLTFANPESVRWMTLGEIATDIFRGAGITRDQITQSGIPCVRYGEIYTTYGVHFDKCVSHTKLENIPSPKFFEHGDILFAITGESIEDIAKSTAYMGKEKCLAGGDIVVLKHKQNPKYLAYALSTTDAQKQKGAGKVKSKVVHSSVPAISELKIPVPSLALQEKIANVLDNFDAVCNDLNIGLPAEISLRKKQYEYYRDRILSFDTNVNNSIHGG
ncbi:MAG: restriction endonuclease subunit S [Fibrobacter sp.]|nr:restriction endonuclease subunit S [Fibrobacter sp.]